MIATEVVNMFIINDLFLVCMTYVRELMSKNVVTLDIEKSAYDAAKLMMERDISTLIITKDNEPIGIVTERDFVRRICGKDMKSSQIKLSEIMSSPLITIGSDMPIDIAAATMAERKIRRLVVVQDSKMLGILTGTDLVKNLREDWARKLDFLIDSI